MRKHTTRFFTMIETMLALGVTAIGICSIMVLFPIGATANMDTAMETYCANAADEVLHLVKYEITDAGHWNDYVGASPETGYFRTTGSDSVTPSTYGFDPMGDDPKEPWTTQIPIAKNIIQHDTYKGAFLLISHKLDSETSWGDIAPEDIDMAAVMVVTKRQLNVNGHSIGYNNAVDRKSVV